jgi:hypothetical protein
MRNPLVAAIAVVIAGTVGALSLMPRPAAEPANQPAASAAGTQSPKAAPSPASSQLPAAQPAAKTEPKPAKVGRMLFPDGSQAMALNGVTEDVKLIWGSQPFSPIKQRIMDSRGVEWYVHEDGTYSTVEMRDVRGTMMPFGLVGRPSAELAPLHDEAGIKAQEQKAATGH